MILEFDDFDVRDRFYTIQEKSESLKLELDRFSVERQQAFNEASAQAYIFHDAALEGVVITADEIASVFGSDSDIPYVRSRVLQEIRNHRKKINDIIINAEKIRISSSVYRSAEINIENILSIHEQLFYNIPRKDAGKLRTQEPLHLAYFHDLAEPKSIKDKLLSLCSKSKDPEFRTQHPINQASLFHYDFMQIFPFLEGSGKVGRLFLNSFLLQGGYDLVIIHASERQHYYETLKSGVEDLRDLILDNIESTLDSRLNLIKNNEFFKTKHRKIIRKIEANISART